MDEFSDVPSGVGDARNFACPSPWDRAIESLSLSDQQARIVALILQDKPDKQIAVELGLSPHTVRTYLNRIFTQFKVNGRLGVALHVVAARGATCPRENCPYK